MTHRGKPLTGCGWSAVSGLRKRLAATENAFARIGMSYLRAVARANRCVFIDAEGRTLTFTQIEKVLDYKSAPILVVYWISDAIPVALLRFIHPSFSEAARAIRFLFDDTFWGRISAQYHERLGGRCTVLALRDNPDRLRQLKSLIASRESCGFAVDGGGPYGVVGSGLASLASALGAPIIPIGVQAVPGLTLTRRSKIRLPLPGSRIAVAVGTEIPAGRNASRSLVVEEVARSLNALSVVATSAVSGGGTPRHAHARESQRN